MAIRQTLANHLRHRLRGAYHALERALEGVDDDRAIAGADPAWRRYRWGIGLDGSIAGIIWHVAVWKHVVAAGLETGAFPRENDAAPPASGWPELRRWLAAGHERLLAQAPADDDSLARPIAFEGEEMPLADLFAHMFEHDQYHAG